MSGWLVIDELGRIYEWLWPSWGTILACAVKKEGNKMGARRASVLAKIPGYLQNTISVVATILTTQWNTIKLNDLACNIVCAIGGPSVYITVLVLILNHSIKNIFICRTVFIKFHGISICSSRSRLTDMKC